MWILKEGGGIRVQDARGNRIVTNPSSKRKVVFARLIGMNFHRFVVPQLRTSVTSLTLALFLVSSAWAISSQQTQESQAPAPVGTVFVHTALGGFILGYDIDQAGSEGLLCEALTLSDGKHNVAVETFDQRTGNIIRIVAQETETNNDFVALGIVGQSVGLVEHELARNLFVNRRFYNTLNPLGANRLNGKWTPPLTRDDIISAASEDQGKATTAFLAFQNSGSFSSFVFGSDVAANTFGPLITLDSHFDSFNSPVMAFDSSSNEAVVAVLGSAFGPPFLAKANLTTGAISEFTGVGIGFVNGIAVDSNTGMACTTTEIDFSVEFYNLATETGFAVPLPGAVSQLQRGTGVASDPIHGLFLVAQPVSSTAGSGSSIQVFDEQGNFVESVNGLSIPAGSFALNPSLRSGYVLVAPALNELQSFTY